jgi:hypothetical protein
VAGEGDRVAAAAEMEDDVMAALKPDEPELPDEAAAEFDLVLSEFPLVGDGPADTVLDVRCPESGVREEVAGKPLELVKRREASDFKTERLSYQMSQPTM